MNEIKPEFFDGHDDWLSKRGLSRNSSIVEFGIRIFWGTYGKSGKEPLRWIRICELSNSHLEAIIKTQHHVPPFLKAIMYAILLERWDSGDFEPETSLSAIEG